MVPDSIETVGFGEESIDLATARWIATAIFCTEHVSVTRGTPRNQNASMASERKTMRLKLLTGWLLALVTASDLCAQVKIGDTPPDALGVDRHGNDVFVSAYHGKVVVLSFWASWCHYCLKELPVLEKIQQVIGKSRVEVIAVNIDRNRSDYLAMQRQLKNFQFTMARDERRAAADLYAVDGLPYLLMVSKSGTVAYLHKGYSEKALDGFVTEINSLLDGPEIQAPAPTAGG